MQQQQQQVQQQRHLDKVENKSLLSYHGIPSKSAAVIEDCVPVYHSRYHPYHVKSNLDFSRLNYSSNFSSLVNQQNQTKPKIISSTVTTNPFNSSLIQTNQNSNAYIDIRNIQTSRMVNPLQKRSLSTIQNSNHHRLRSCSPVNSSCSSSSNDAMHQPKEVVFDPYNNPDLRNQLVDQKSENKSRHDGSVPRTNTRYTPYKTSSNKYIDLPMSRRKMMVNSSNLKQ